MYGYQKNKDKYKVLRPKRLPEIRPSSLLLSPVNAILTLKKWDKRLLLSSQSVQYLPGVDVSYICISWKSLILYSLEYFCMWIDLLSHFAFFTVMDCTGSQITSMQNFGRRIVSNTLWWTVTMTWETDRIPTFSCIFLWPSCHQPTLAITTGGGKDGKMSRQKLATP